MDEVEKYFSENPKFTIRKAAQVLKISKSSLHRIIKKFLKLHSYKITTHQLLTTKFMEAGVKFCKTITEMFESGEIDENKIVFSDEGHFWLNGYVNKQNYQFWGTENPNISISKSLHPEKATLLAALSVKGIYLYFFDSIVTGNSYKELLKIKLFPFAKKRVWVKTFHFMQDGATPYRTKGVFKAIYNVYGNRVIGLEYPKFAHGGIEWPPYYPDLNPCDFFL